MSRMQTVNFVAINAARDQALKLGAGFVRILPDGGMEHVDTRIVQVHEDAPVCGGDGLGPNYDR